ncbi:hypothetical protein CPB83DRAFT_895800 [Crepidotus variabilis]|uniref:Zinc-finger domain-containing protein n=1 Tax=Crepidotus variabilis TaxID=179855 RepID=A0A9P6JN48_9AGAR|nr:hypothetical protein CPB83DRAFT_895800 [Crepidotus variabilis]
MTFALQNQTDASLTPTRTFIPRLDSALHIYSPTSTRQTPSKAPVQRLPSPSSDKADAISVYTADADGDVDDEAVVEQTLLSINSPSKEPESRQSPDRQTNATPNWEDLFGSEPSPAEHQRSVTPQPTPRRKRLVMSHVLVPPFRKSKDAYSRMFRRQKAPRPTEDPHVDVAFALQAAFQHNHDLGTLSTRTEKPKKKLKLLSGQTAKSRAEHDVPVASTSHSKTTILKRKIILCDDEGDDEHIPPKRRRLDTFIDLTISDDDESLARPHDIHHPHQDTPSLSQLESIAIQPHTPIPPAILVCNLRNTLSQVTQKLLSLPYEAPSLFINSSRRRCALVDQGWLDEQGATELSGATNSVFDDEANDDIQLQDGSSSMRASSSHETSGRFLTPTAPKIDLAARFRPKKTTSRITVKNQSAPLPTSSILADTLDDVDHSRITFDPPLKPSAKALGKRKAIDTITHLPTPSSLSSTSESNPQSPQPGLRTTGTGDIFINSFNPSPSQGSMFIHTDVPLTSTGSPSNRDPLSFSKYANNSTLLSASFSRYGSSAQLHDDFSQVDTVLDDEGGLGSHESWSQYLEDEVVRTYSFDTVNPSLLGPPDPPVTFNSVQEDGLGIWMSNDDPEPSFLTASGSTLESSFPVSPTASSTTSKLGLSLVEKEMDRRSPSPLILPAPHVGSPRRSPPRFWLSGSVVPKRQRKRRLMKDMVAVEDVVGSSVESSRAATEECAHSEDGSTIRVSRFLNRMFEKSGGAFIFYGGEKWPKGAALFCHQCRNKPEILKLNCPTCNKCYCVRCLSCRYQSEPRAFDMDTSSCPACLGYCNCTSCCQKRGVKYVPSEKRPKKRAAASTASDDRQSNHSRVALGGRTNLPSLITAKEHLPVNEELYPTSASIQPPLGPKVYWSTIYGLNGAKIGTSFAASDAAIGPPDMVYTARPANLIPSSSKRSSIVWVGEMQPSWGLGKRVQTKELEPALNVKHKKISSHRIYPVYCEPRMYVGKRSLLFCQSEAAAKELADLSDLTDVEDEGDRFSQCSPNSGAPTMPFSADCLTEQDIRRAIELALAACGIPLLK